MVDDRRDTNHAAPTQRPCHPAFDPRGLVGEHQQVEDVEGGYRDPGGAEGQCGSRAVGSGYVGEGNARGGPGEPHGVWDVAGGFPGEVRGENVRVDVVSDVGAESAVRGVVVGRVQVSVPGGLGPAGVG